MVERLPKIPQGLDQEEGPLDTGKPHRCRGERGRDCRTRDCGGPRARRNREPGLMMSDEQVLLRGVGCL